MAHVNLITPEEAYPRVKGGGALLVCAYNDDEAFRKNNLEGAVSYAEFSSRLPGISKDQEIIFYCA